MSNYFGSRSMEWAQEVEQFWSEKEGERMRQKFERDETYKIEAMKFFEENELLKNNSGMFEQIDLKPETGRKPDDISTRGFTRIGNTLAYMFNREKR